MAIEVTEINIKIGQKKVSLSPDQARELMEVLEGLLGAPKTVKRIIERQPWRWWYVNTPYTQPATWITYGDNTAAGKHTGSYSLTLNQ